MPRRTVKTERFKGTEAVFVSQLVHPSTHFGHVSHSQFFVHTGQSPGVVQLLLHCGRSLTPPAHKTDHFRGGLYSPKWMNFWRHSERGGGEWGGHF